MSAMLRFYARLSLALTLSILALMAAATALGRTRPNGDLLAFGSLIDVSRNLIVDLPLWGSSPSWSPDGRHIAITSGREGDGEFNQEIYVMDMSGNSLRNLSNHPTFDRFPVWSPDSRHIAFVSYRDGGDGQIYVVDVEEGGLRNLPNQIACDCAPQWSPDGQEFVFISYGDRGEEVYVVGADGDNLRNLSKFPVDNRNNPRWSPDGSRIAFGALRDDEAIKEINEEIYVVDVRSGNLQNLTNHPAADLEPQWSPDGTRILFKSTRDGGNIDLYVVDADGENLHNISNDPGNDDHPKWSPEGNQIAFISTRDRVSAKIYVVDADGNNLYNLIDLPISAELDFTYDEGASFSWSPDGSLIALSSFSEGSPALYIVDSVSGAVRSVFAVPRRQPIIPIWQPRP